MKLEQPWVHRPKIMLSMSASQPRLLYRDTRRGQLWPPVITTEAVDTWGMAHAPSMPCKPLRKNDFEIVDTPKFQISISCTYSPISLKGKRLSWVVPSSLTSTVGDPEDHLPPSSRIPSSSRQDR